MHKTLYLKEYQSCIAPDEILSDSGEILIFPEVLGKNYFSLRYKIVICYYKQEDLLG